MKRDEVGKWVVADANSHKGRVTPYQTFTVKGSLSP